MCKRCPLVQNKDLIPLFKVIEGCSEFPVNPAGIRSSFLPHVPFGCDDVPSLYRSVSSVMRHGHGMSHCSCLKMTTFFKINK